MKKTLILLLSAFLLQVSCSKDHDESFSPRRLLRESTTKYTRDFDGDIKVLEYSQKFFYNDDDNLERVDYLPDGKLSSYTTYEYSGEKIILE